MERNNTFNIHTLPIAFSHQGLMQTITPVIIRDDQHSILLDCGYPGFLPLLEEAAQTSGLQLESLTHIIVTHHDIDHMGALAELIKAYPAIHVIAFELEALYVTGKRKSLRLIQAEETLMEYEIHRLICYHGGLFQGDAKAALKDLLQRART